MDLSCYDCPFFYNDIDQGRFNCGLEFDLPDPSSLNCRAPTECPFTKGQQILVTYDPNKGLNGFSFKQIERET